VTAQIEIAIEQVDPTSLHLPIVMALGRANTKTLGFLRDSAFVDYAKRQGILVALDPQGNCIGYVMYRCPRQQITIAHLCIDKSWRGKGVAKKLVEYLSQNHKELYGIGLWCRRDYSISKMWPRLGFVAKGEKPGNSKEGKPLTYWWRDHGHPNLFSKAARQELESKLRVVLDANVFFDLHSEDDIDSEESKSLLADWLQPELELCLTDEIDNEINRNDNPIERDKQWKLAQKFERLEYHSQDFEGIASFLRRLFPEKMTESDESDLRQLVRTIASDAQLFITRDQRLLDIAEEVYENFGVTILRPTDLIIKLDELRRETEYQPIRLAGTLLEKKRLHGRQESLLTQHFQCSNQGESKTDFQRKLRKFLSDPQLFECLIVTESVNKPLALVAYDRQKKHELEIPMLRIVSSPLASTMARHLILQSISLSAREQRKFTRITEPYLDKTVATAIREDAFVRAKNGWLRTNISIAETASTVSRLLTDLAATFGQEYIFCNDLVNILSTDGSTADSQTMAEIERFLWPAKIIDAEIPTFIIPIQPVWASHLFDENLANETLFGAKPELAFNREAVYYKRALPHGGVKAPGRILWYVSDDKDDGFSGLKSIRACSRLDEVIVGKPKELFRKFQRLGIYQWNDIFETANRDINQDIMVIRFSDTELFKNFVSFDEVKNVISQTASIMSPRFISHEKFAKIYKQGVHK
jgi:predicted GNAT family acetyltransferase/predicted nucleic acid-binding protein